MNCMKRSLVAFFVFVIAIALVSFGQPSVAFCDDSFFSDLYMASPGNSGTGSEGSEVVKSVKIGSYEVTGDGEVVSHNYFERELDGAPFYNFTSTETSMITHISRDNMGTCYGISMFAIRYFQWFILPSLLDDKALAKVRGKKFFGLGPAKTDRHLPAYAKKMAKAFHLPSWVLQWPEGSQAERTKRIEPYRLRAFLTNNEKLAAAVKSALTDKNMAQFADRFDPKLAKEFAVRMFDNQMGLIRKGSQLYEMLSRQTHEFGNSDSKLFKALFGRCAFDTMKKNIDNDRFGCTEIGMWGSKLKPMWGHSVVAYKITEFDAVNGQGEQVKAYKIDIYDNNDPFNTSDNAFWYFSDVQKFTPSDKYADFYDGDSPLKPAGKEFMNAIQMGPSTEAFTMKFEENLMNRFSFNLEKVKVND